MSERHQVCHEIQANLVEKTLASQSDRLREKFDTKIETRRRIKIHARRRAEMIARLYKMRVCCQNGQIMIINKGNVGDPGSRGEVYEHHKVHKMSSLNIRN